MVKLRFSQAGRQLRSASKALSRPAALAVIVVVAAGLAGYRLLPKRDAAPDGAGAKPLLEAGNNPEIAGLNQLIATEEDSQELYNLYVRAGGIYVSGGRYDLAVAAYAAARPYLPQDERLRAAYYTSLARAYEYGGELDQAIEAYRQARDYLAGYDADAARQIDFRLSEVLEPKLVPERAAEASVYQSTKGQGGGNAP